MHIKFEKLLYKSKILYVLQFENFILRYEYD